MDPGSQALDFVLPHQNISYTPCARNHTHHAEDWPLTGTISIDKCERQCRFRACKSWSQTAAALRKHVNAHIINNKLDLRVLPSSNGREPLKISAGDDLVTAGEIAQHGFHQGPTIKPNPYSNFDPQSPPAFGSDSGYVSTPSSVQRMADEANTFQWKGESRGNTFQWSAPGKRPSPFLSFSQTAQKRIRGEGNPDRESTESTKNSSLHERSLPPYGGGSSLSPQRLDAIMAKAQTLRESSAQASLAASSKEKSPFAEGSPLAPSQIKPRPPLRDMFPMLDRVTEQKKNENHGASSAKSLNGQRVAKTISPKVLGLEYHEHQERSLLASSQDAESRHESFHFLGETSGDPLYRKPLPLDRGDILDAPLRGYERIDGSNTWPPRVRERRPDWASTLPAQVQFENAVDTSAINAHVRRVSSIIEELDDGYSGTQHGPSAASHNYSDERSQTNTDHTMTSDRDFDLFFQDNFNTTASHPTPQNFKTAKGPRARRQSSRVTPTYDPNQKFAEPIQSNGHAVPNPTHLTRELLFIRLPETPSQEATTDSADDPLQCPTCKKLVKTRSELKKHDLRHTKPFRCDIPDCPRAEGFSTSNDLDRHVKSKHPEVRADIAQTRFRCRVSGCKSAEMGKSWHRLDNFKSHLKRVHQHILTESEIERISDRSECATSSGNVEAATAKPRTPAPVESRTEDESLDLQSLHVLADSAAYLGWNQWPPSKEQKTEGVTA